MRYRGFVFAQCLIVALAFLGEAPAEASESGSIHVYVNYGANRSPNVVRDANDHGCNDHWADFHFVPEDKLGRLGVWATNAVNQGHINLHNGLDGFYECTGGLCNVHLCTKNWQDFLGSDAWSVRLYVP